MVVFEVPTLYCNFGKTNKKRNWRPPNDGSYDGHHHYFTIKSLTKLFEKHYRIVSIESGTQAPAILLIGGEKMIKICHMASYNKNIGDNAAIYNIRNWFKTNSSLPVSWSSLDMNEFYSKKNSISFSKDFFKKANKKFDAIFIGGGGLIEGHLYNQNHTGWKLPFNHEILELIDIPLFAIGLGVNYFRGCEHLSGDGKKNLNLLVNKATRFSVRNDGSQEILEKYGIVSREIPDPGLIFHSSSIKQRKVVLKSAFFQPAKNSNPKINHFRGLSIESLNFLNDFCKKCNMAILPHTLKDFRFFLDMMWMVKILSVPLTLQDSEIFLLKVVMSKVSQLTSIMIIQLL